MTLVPRLAQRTGAPVVLIYGERLPKGRGYRTHFHPVGDAIRDADPAVAAAALNRGVETCVRECPSQYQWSYRRFKTRPEGEESLY
jgi:KDO2-lipid IV(A) lauroyltransferase